MSACSACGAQTALKRAKEYREDIGIPIILEDCVEVQICTTCGHEESERIPDPEGLIAVAAIARIEYPLKLNGREIRFLRKARMLTAKELADELEVSVETVSRWENGKLAIGPHIEKVFRMKTWLGLKIDAPGLIVRARDIMGMKVKSVRGCDDSYEIRIIRRQKASEPDMGSDDPNDVVDNDSAEYATAQVM